ncbi:MAG: hypothetical protein KAJ10_10190 [Thermodesulfovibrionia bacterium]|nr:hypothetical protein [Thermodesulfovibrionia bacterium]
MKELTKFKSRMKVLSLTLLSLLIAISYTSVSYAEWSHGIGTGIFMLNLEGDVGVNTTLAGPVTVEDADLDFDDISDLLETAIGLGGYSTDGTWMIRYLFSTLELEGEKSYSLPANAVLAGGHSVNAKLNFKRTAGEITVGYPVYKDTSFSVSMDGGLRYTKHEVRSDLSISGPVLNRGIRKEIDEDWTDVLIGGTVTVPFTKELIWNTSGNAGFGGSEGTYMGQTGLTWIFYKGFSSTLYGMYTAVEFENGDEGDSDWYLYDVDEFGLGLSFAYNW